MMVKLLPYKRKGSEQVLRGTHVEQEPQLSYEANRGAAPAWVSSRAGKPGHPPLVPVVGLRGGKWPAGWQRTAPRHALSIPRGRRSPRRALAPSFRLGTRSSCSSSSCLRAPHGSWKHWRSPPHPRTSS